MRRPSLLRRALALAALGSALGAGAPAWAQVEEDVPVRNSRRVNFGEDNLDGEISRPELTYFTKRGKARFPCDITQLTVEQYNQCFERQMAEMCGVQLVERERYEFEHVGTAMMQSGRARTLGASFPQSIQLDDGAVFAEESNDFGGWGERHLLLKNQSPPLAADLFVATRKAFVLGDRRAKRVYVLGRYGSSEHGAKFEKVELASGSHSLLGVLTTRSFVISTRREVLLMSLDGKAGVRLRVPPGQYTVDPEVDRRGQMLLTSAAPNGGVYLVAPDGDVTGAFRREPEFGYHLMPNGLIASVHLGKGLIRIRNHSGLVLSTTSLGRPLQQFGVLRQKKGADLYFVTSDGVGVLWSDGFEKSFLSRPGVGLRVVEADDGVLGVLVSTSSREDPRPVKERQVEFYRLGRRASRVAKIVEGICPNAIQIAERALELKSSLRATMKDGRFDRVRPGR